MCGIAGFWNKDGQAASENILRKQLDTIIHRGPDDRGVWLDRDIAFGHQRLTILDLSSRGHQPFVTADGLGVFTYNGEIYNYIELRKELEEEGVNFVSTSDTEVALYALHHWGPEKAIPRFNGMFAFAYLDRRTNELVLSRDRIGIKPLYVSKTDRSIVFASEIKALLAHPHVRCEPDRYALSIHALLNRIDGEITPFLGIETLIPGTYWKVTKDGINVSTYFDPLRDFNIERLISSSKKNPETLVKELGETLNESVRIHLASDVPLATMCSGGVDSSLVTALVKNHDPDVVGYVANVEGKSEGIQARKVGKHLDAKIRQVDFNTEDMLRKWPHTCWFGDQPQTHPSDMPMLAVSEACNEDGIKVILTGEGSDELFGGYYWQMDSYWSWRRWRRLPFRKMDMNNRWLRGLVSLLPRRIDIEEPVSHIPFTTTPVHNDWLRLTLPLDPVRQVRGAEFIDKLEGAGNMEERAFLARGLDDLYGHLRSLLMWNDRMGMGASLETRVPFIENYMINLGMHSPFNAKYRDGEGKWLVKNIAKDYLPHEVVYATKRGFPVRMEFVNAVLPLLKGGLVADLFRWDSRTAKRLIRLVSQDTDAMWRLGSIEIWARLFLNGESTDELSEKLLRNNKDGESNRVIN